MHSQYPLSFDSLRAWATENNILPGEARIRFAQYAILRAISTSRRLRTLLVFKGGNALDFVWQANRSTQDLDFSVDMSTQSEGLTSDELQEFLSPALATSTRFLGIGLRINKIAQQPPGLNRSFITYDVSVHYALQDEPKLLERIVQGQASTHVISVEISLNEVVCDDREVQIDPSHYLRVSTLEDIVAEKLRALLQQPIRNRTRRQDLLDIAVILLTHPELDQRLVGQFLIRKCQARDVPVTRAAFRDPDVAHRASRDYAELELTTRTLFVPFAEAREALYAFVNQLDIPLT